MKFSYQKIGKMFNNWLKFKKNKKICPSFIFRIKFTLYFKV